eukprot:g8874.t1
MTESTSIVAPLWFDIERLKDASFNAETYVTELRRYVPLDTISNQLDTYLQQLKLQLVEVINEKYNDFIGLAGKLTGVEGAITRIKKPLMDLMMKLQVVERGLESELDLLSMSLVHRQKLVIARRQLELMQNAIQTGTKIEKLITEIDIPMGSIDFVIKSSLLERVSQEIGKLDLILSEEEESELELITNLLRQNAEFKEKVKTLMMDSLKEALTLPQPDHASVLRILHGLSIIGATQDGEVILKDCLMDPLYSSLRHERDLKILFEKFVEQVFQSYNGLFPVLLKSPPGLESYCFLANCLIKSLHEEIRRNRSTVYSPGNPDSFLVNFKSVQFLMGQLEVHCPTKMSLDQFRSSPVLINFLKDWNLAVYFAMRFQEIAGLLDSVLMTDRSQNKSPDSVIVISVWMESMQKCFASNSFIDQLNDQFVKLFLKLLSRFEHWLKMSLASNAFKSNEDLALLEKELEKPAALLRTKFYLTGLPEDCWKPIEETVEAFLKRLEALRQESVTLIASQLVTDCTALVKKSVGTAVSTMFHPTSDRPTQANDYIQRLLDPLRLFLNSPHVRVDIKSEVKLSVGKGVCKAYRQALVDVLGLWEKSRMSLKRINKNRLTPAAATSEQDGSNPTELGNVYQQHWLDVSAFGQVLLELELPPLTEYTELKDLIISKKEEET